MRANSQAHRHYVRSAKNLVAAALLCHQAKALRALLAAPPWVVLSYSWDSTPERARQVAVVPGTQTKRTTAGVKCHLLQVGSVCLLGDAGIRREELLVPPLVVEGNSAGVLLSALQRSWTSLNVHPVRLGRDAGLVVLHLAIDSHSANLKLVKFLRWPCLATCSC